MKYLLAVCVTLFVCTELLTFTVADTVKICTSNKTKCDLGKIANFSCVESKDCVKEVLEGKADVAKASANSMTKNGDRLKVVYGLKVSGVPENFVQYYGLAVVKKGTSFNFKQLKGKNSCHTGVGRTVGWNIPVGYLIYTREMKFINNSQYISAADFFGKSCAPGSRGIKDISNAIKDDLCSLCNGTCGTDSTEGYYSYAGAFICMAEGNKDRVGFVKQTTANEVLNNKKYPQGKYGTSADYELLCTDGTKKGLEQYQDCNIDKRPASAFIVKSNTSAPMVAKIQGILKTANFADLQAGGIVSSSEEKLVPHEASAKEYVGSYGSHYNALTAGPPAKNPTPTSAASSVFVSFSLPIIAIFAFLQLAYRCA